MYDRKHADTFPPWKEMLTPLGAADLVQKIPYKRDGFKELRDAFHHPACGSALINFILGINDLDASVVFNSAVVRGKVMTSDLNKIRMAHTDGESWDCDDSALWCAWAVKSGFNARILNVVWRTGRWPWNVAGHNVCVCRQGDQFVHIGNWGHRGPFDSMDDVVDDILSSVGEKQLVGYHVMSRDQLTAKF
jgi:hypothetical protein